MNSRGYFHLVILILWYLRAKLWSLEAAVLNFPEGNTEIKPFMGDLDNHSISTVCQPSVSRAWLWSALTADMRLQHRRFKSTFSRRFLLNPFKLKITDKSHLDIVDKSDFHTARHFAGVHAEGKHVIQGSSHVSDDLSPFNSDVDVLSVRQAAATSGGEQKVVLLCINVHVQILHSRYC